LSVVEGLGRGGRLSEILQSHTDLTVILITRTNMNTNSSWEFWIRDAKYQEVHRWRWHAAFTPLEKFALGWQERRNMAARSFVATGSAPAWVVLSWRGFALSNRLWRGRIHYCDHSLDCVRVWRKGEAAARQMGLLTLLSMISVSDPQTLNIIALWHHYQACRRRLGEGARAGEWPRHQPSEGNCCADHIHLIPWRS